MLQRYTFLDHPFKAFLNNSRQLINGLDKCVAVFYNQYASEEQVLMYDGKLSSLAFDDNHFIDKIRTSTKKTNWIKPAQVPFETKTPQIEQLSFADEEESSVLELRFFNEADKKADVIYLYFKNHIGNFKLSNTNEAMGIAIKEVIQNLMYNQIVLLLKEVHNNKEIHQKIAESSDLEVLKSDIFALKEENFRKTKEAYTYILNQLTSLETTEFALSKSAVKKISQLKLSLPQVKELLESSLEVLINKYNLNKVYEIADYDIIVRKTVSHQTVAEESLDKTAAFLDRYEQAANILTAKNLKITGVNIGAYCEPNISAAAISDILKKHHKKITLLLQQNPNKWKTIRSRFRPIISISENKAYLRNTLSA